jgi:Fe-S cluster biosynthesis and repair protein YggX
MPTPNTPVQRLKVASCPSNGLNPVLDLKPIRKKSWLKGKSHKTKPDGFKRQKEPGEITEKIYVCVRPELVEKWPNTMTAKWDMFRPVIAAVQYYKRERTEERYSHFPLFMLYMYTAICLF